MKIFTVRLFGLALVGAFLLAGCKLPLQVAEPSATPIELHLTIPPATAPEIPAGTALPTDTAVPVDTATPTPSPTVLYSVALTFSPTPTRGPGVEVKIRNNTGYNVNLYRYGLSGEIHFLGWLVPKYYGLFRFPSLREWKIRYCERAEDGSDSNCKTKIINFKVEGKEDGVP